MEGQQAANHIPGVAFVAVKDDKVLFCEAMGLRDLDAKVPVTAETVFPIGSCTKSFTAIAAGISHDQGKLSLDDSAHKFLPWLRMADREANELVTLRDMFFSSLISVLARSGQRLHFGAASSFVAVAGAARRPFVIFTPAISSKRSDKSSWVSTTLQVASLGMSPVTLTTIPKVSSLPGPSLLI